jgi:hypothetical protein
MQPTAGEIDALIRSFIEIPLVHQHMPIDTTPVYPHMGHHRATATAALLNNSDSDQGDSNSSNSRHDSNTTRSVDPTHAHAQLELIHRHMPDLFEMAVPVYPHMGHHRATATAALLNNSDSDQGDSNSSNSRHDSSNQNSASVHNYFDSASTQFFDDSTSEMSSDDGLPPMYALGYHVGHTNEDHDLFWEENTTAWQQTFQAGESSTDDDMPDLEEDLLVIRISRIIDVVLYSGGPSLALRRLDVF